MRKRLYLLSLITFIILVVAACGRPDSSDQDSDQTMDRKTNQQEEPTTKIIKKFNDTIQDWPGMAYTSQQTVTVNADEQEETFTRDVTMDAQITFDPLTMKMSGETVMQNMPRPLETYYVDHVMYTKTEGQWIGIKDMTLSQFIEQTQGQNPQEQMDLIQNILKTIPDDHKAESVNIEEKANTYVVTIHLNENTASDVKNLIMEQLNGAIEQPLQQIGLDDPMEVLTIKAMDQTIYIKKDSFEQSALKQQVTMEVPVEGMTMTINMDVTIDINGKVNEPITVPGYVKENAEMMSIDKLKKTQEGETAN